MLGRATARRSTLDIRRCCSCGYGGHFAQLKPEAARRRAAHCPRCGCDFATRPPRSYAEMEGLDEEVATGGAASVVPSESTMVERWLVLGCLVVVLLGIGFALAANILSSISAW
jgi:hypothetical protein